MEEKLNKGYEPHDVERKWYRRWEADGYFRADEKSVKAPLLDRHPAAERHRCAAHGPCPQQHPAGYPGRWKRMRGL